MISASEVLAKLSSDFKSAVELTGLEALPIKEVWVGLERRFVSICKASFRGESCVGIGSSGSPDKAAFVSFMELYERLVFVEASRSQTPPIYRNGRSGDFCLGMELSQKYPNAKHWVGRSSNGIAAHRTLEDAQQSALSELVERHTILKAIWMKTPPKAITTPRREAYRTPDISFGEFVWNGACERHVVVVKGKKGERCIYAFGAAKCLERALDKAWEEFHLKLGVASSTLPDPLKFIFGSPHAKFHWEAESDFYRQFFSDEGVAEVPGIDIEFGEEKVWYRTLPALDFITEKDQVVVVKAVSPQFQQLFWGPWRAQKVNPEALPPGALPIDLHIVG